MACPLYIKIQKKNIINNIKIMIHKSHSKKNLIELFEALHISFDKNKNKREIINEITNLIQNKLTVPKNSYHIKDLSELIQYLTKPNIKEKISIDEKNKVMLKCKRIIQYAKSGYNFEITDYTTRQELYNDIIFISPYGFIPSVRRACKLYNQDLNKIEHINPIIPLNIQADIDLQRKVKRNNFYNFKMRKGKFIVLFE
jgi:hypothetical protein